MRRLSSTVVVVAGEQSGKVVSGLDGLHNVRAISRGERSPAEIEEAVHRSTATYVVHDADPLAAVGDAWVGLFDGAAPVGGLEVAIEAALAGLRSDRLALPDYYVVLDPDDMPVTRRHWWLGALAGSAPSRVVPARASAAAVTDALSRLSSGRWWPSDLEGWLRGLTRAVPDRVGLPSSSGLDPTP
ncbi:hypothetical protein [Actinoallomurus oryzae]|uniref:hypothetical protein n=1 Tax=Actinoallomurus oryzae TaxID=502180 RepID=UPI0031E8FD07